MRSVPLCSAPLPARALPGLLAVRETSQGDVFRQKWNCDLLPHTPQHVDAATAQLLQCGRWVRGSGRRRAGFPKGVGLWVRVHSSAASSGSWPDVNSFLLLHFTYQPEIGSTSLVFIRVFDYTKRNVIGVYSCSHFSSALAELCLQRPGESAGQCYVFQPLLRTT